MGTAWVLAAMAAAVGAFIFGRGRAEPAPRDEPGPREPLEGLAPGHFLIDDDTRPAVAEPTRQERLNSPAWR